MAPISKSLPQRPVGVANIPVQASSPSLSDGAAVNQPISAFQWISLARATWTWLLKPLWYLCVKWPVMMILSPSSRKEREERLEQFWKDHAQQQDDARWRADWEERNKSW
jgi:hypothetical protein